MRRSRLPNLAVTGVVVLLAALLPAPAYAHGFGERYDLPVPLWLYLAGAGAAVALSFAVIGVYMRGAADLRRYPRLNLLRYGAGRLLVHPGFTVPVQLASVALFVLVVAAGLFGDPTPTRNLAPTLVWVLWWVGLAYVSALVGDVWAVTNPWKITFGWAESAYRKLACGRELTPPLRYPDRLGVWPGAVLFLAFAWIELVYVESAAPVRIGQLAIAYSVITWGGMLLYGRDRWLRHGEAFSLAFGLLARFAPTEVRATSAETCDACRAGCAFGENGCIGCISCFRRAPSGQRELNLRPYAVGLLSDDMASPSMMTFAVLILATVTFDGFTATPVWSDIAGALYRAVGNGTAVGSVGLIAFPSLFLGVYVTFAALMGTASGRSLPVGDLARAFVYSLVPIALAYHLAHFLSFLLIQGQLIMPLASDPFGYGWDLFGTTGIKPNIGIVNARFAWFAAVAAIVSGHIVAVYLAHFVALRTLGERRAALRSQYPMLALMVGYTMVSLWILAQPIVEATPGA